MYPVYLLEVHLSGPNPNRSWFGGTCGSGSRDGRSWSWSHPQKKKIWQNELQTQTDPRKKKLRSSCKFHMMPKIWTQHQSKLLKRSLTNLHRFLSCRDRNNLVSCTFKVQQTVPLKFFLSTDPSWVGRSNETSSNQSQGTLNQKKGKEGALLQHQGANYKMIVKSEPPQRRVRVQLFCHFHCDKHVFIQMGHFFISNL